MYFSGTVAVLTFASSATITTSCHVSPLRRLCRMLQGSKRNLSPSKDHLWEVGVLVVSSHVWTTCRGAGLPVSFLFPALAANNSADFQVNLFWVGNVVDNGLW